MAFDALAESREAPPARDDVELGRLEKALRDRVDGEVRFDAQARSLYSTDASQYRQVPVGVVVPKSVDDVEHVVAACRAFDVPITSRGGGTSLAGQCCNAAVVIDFSKHLNRILEIDPAEQHAWVEPGCVLDELRNATEEHGLTFGPDPSTHTHNTLGGMIGNNSCGIHSVMAGRTADNVEALDILTYDGHRMTVGRTDGAAFDEVVEAGGRRAEIYRGLTDLRDRYAPLLRERYPDIPRRVSGYNLNELLPERGFNVARALVGTEGTCVTVLRAKLKLVPSPPVRCLVVLGYRDVYAAADGAPEVMRHGPVGIEGIDDKLVLYMKAKGLHPEDVELLPEGSGWLLVEFGGGSGDEARGKAEALVDALDGQQGLRGTKVFDEPWETAKVWEVREAGLAATAHVPMMSETHPGWEDAGIPPEKLGSYLRDFRGLLDRYGYDCSLYGHFGDGCVHCRIDFDYKTRGGVDAYLSFIRDAADLVVSYGGSLSGEHGDGQSRAALLERMYGGELTSAFREFKRLWDPRGRMNPGKVVDAYRPDENLRQGPDYRPWAPETQFAYPDDDHNFARAAGRCVGVGKCRKHDAGVMCPSYRATYEEAYSTRGRARMLFEMVNGDLVRDGWRSEAVKEALDYCLACKACKTECPVNVDMATYKAEFMHGHYKGRLRPRDEYAMGLIWWWSRAAAHAPKLANAVLQSSGLGGVMKRLAGLAPARSFPSYAETPFRKWFAGAELMLANGEIRRGGHGHDVSHGDLPRHTRSSFHTPVTGRHRSARNRLNPMAESGPSGSRRVLLWPDTFNAYFTPGPLQAAAHVLSEAGYRVEIPRRPLCCGRPLYAPGMLTLARRLWRRNLAELEPYIREGVPVVAVEPSCVSAFRDELANLFHDDEDARRLAQQVHLLSEFLEMENYRPPKREGRAVVHGHCHHRAILQMDAETTVLKKMGLDVEMLDDTCCGMAGDFGFREKTYEVAMKTGEYSFLPALRRTPEEVPFVANGFSCREQARQVEGRTPTTLPELLHDAIRRERNGAAEVEEDRGDG